MEFNELSAELQAKVRSCKTPEDLLALAKEEGYELSETELEGIAGGGFWDDECTEFKPCEDDGCWTAYHA